MAPVARAATPVEAVPLEPVSEFDGTPSTGAVKLEGPLVDTGTEADTLVLPVWIETSAVASSLRLARTTLISNFPIV